MAFKLKELEGTLGEVIAQLGVSIGFAQIEQVEGEYEMWCQTSYFIIPELNLHVHKGEISTYSTKNKMMEKIPCYLFFDSGAHHFLYSEQSDNLLVSIQNFCKVVGRYKEYALNKIEQLDCNFTIDRNEVLQIYTHFEQQHMTPLCPIRMSAAVGASSSN